MGMENSNGNGQSKRFFFQSLLLITRSVVEIFWLLDDMAGNPGNSIHLRHPLDGPTNTLISPDENGTGICLKKYDNRTRVYILSLDSDVKKNFSSTHQQNGTVFPNEVPYSTEYPSWGSCTMAWRLQRTWPSPCVWCGVAGQQRHLAVKYSTTKRRHTQSTSFSVTSLLCPHDQ